MRGWTVTDGGAKRLIRPQSNRSHGRLSTRRRLPQLLRTDRGDGVSALRRPREVVVEVEDIHESGAGVGRTEDGFIIMIDGVLPPARSRVEVTNVHSNHARAEEVERLELEEEEDEEEDAESEGSDEDEEEEGPQLGSRDNFWGG